MSISIQRGKLGILVGGGPAPGINGVIRAVTLEALKRNWEVVGFYDGYQWLSAGNIDDVCEKSAKLTVEDVYKIHFQGGSILRTSRTNPRKIENGVQNCVTMLKEVGIDKMVTIGGDDTVYGAYLLSEEAKKQGLDIQFAHVPKTIDNDLPLPENINTFGFATACHVGATLMKNLMHDAKTTNRWMLAVAMGRHTGHLALGIGKASGATLTIVPEQFENKTITIDDVCDLIQVAMVKCNVRGQNHGVAVIAEGISELLPDEEIEKIPGSKITRDSFGNRRLADVNLALGIRTNLEKRFSELGKSTRLVSVELGYLLRCADPIPQDQIYTKDLGYSAVYFLLNKDDKCQGNVVICLDNGELNPIPFQSIISPETGKSKVRYLNTNSYVYRIAQEYMMHLNDRDLDNTKFLAQMAAELNMNLDDFKERFKHTVFHSPKDISS
ncbi:6-phosphofructokinase [Candidatus Uabimicrobium amorphum]|uniref:Pyrophosphate--fructose 6-phosphate1-phosphotransferase n=1 Tax=Uabimicrobium amorphum TaxID=2596890 RepID=A0A5S9ILV0_UABAM|nr:6-phosphofructokinase [Candidatus Uabimicrobium amorphum]BBM83816.1 pyrophosphate--fructose 6-phosphate1-phosphotransferase [Candidatus Uabimicrobium amorphum]